MTTLRYPADGAVILTETDRQRAFRNSSREQISPDRIDWLNLERKGEDFSFPAPAEFRWETDEETSCFLLAEDAAFTDPIVRKTEETHLTMGSLKAGQTYYWTVNDSEIRTFTTEDTPPRRIAVDGITNVRDNGGWKTADGRRMKQGLIYRGSEMDTHCSITGEGIRVMLDELKIRTDLDIRGEAVGRITESPLEQRRLPGKSVDFRLIPVAAYADFLKEEHKPVTKRIFALLADETAYPIYYHCWGGADRTGTIAYLLEALLGVPEEDLILDYEMTSLSVWGNRMRHSDLFSGFEEELKKYDEDGTPQSRAEKYLLSCGVMPETIAKLRRNLLE